MSGQGLAGLIPSLVQLALTATRKNADSDSLRASAYFCSTILLALFVMVGYQILLPRLSVKKKHLGYQQTRTEDDDDHQHVETTGTDDHHRNSSASLVLNNSSNIKTNDSIYIAVFKRVWLLGLALWLGFVITLAPFPAITAAVRSQNPSNGLIVPVHFVIFNFIPTICNAKATGPA